MILSQIGRSENMRLPEEYDDKNAKKPVTYMFAGVCIFIVVLFAIVFFMNTEPKRKNNVQNDSDKNQQIVQDRDDSSYTSSGLVADDLDFWNMYPENEGVNDDESEDDKQTVEQEEEKENDPATDGKHTKITYADGTEEWVLISQHLPKNTYDFTKLVSQSGVMKYYEEGNQTSYFGLDISKTQGYIDYNKVKKAGVDYVMLRVGARGYSTGQLILDEYFLDNIKGATDAKLHVGLYFSSQAKTVDEAIEEANMVLNNIGEYKVDYPIVFEMETIVNDDSRTSILTKQERTDITVAFCDTIKNAGYIPMVWGNKEWLLTKVDLSKLTSYDIWLQDENDLPDYPYQFSMWQYNSSGAVEGISTNVSFNISFIDYTEK